MRKKSPTSKPAGVGGEMNCGFYTAQCSGNGRLESCPGSGLTVTTLSQLTVLSVDLIKQYRQARREDRIDRRRKLHGK